MRRNQSALLAKYYTMYKKNPRSRVFAPLAEAFRNLGMLDDAFKILKDGIRNHPNYTLGYIVLAHCYFDQDKYELTYNTLRPIVAQNADNISLQKIFAQACLQLGHLEEALDTYKYLLFMNPQEKTFAQEVKRLEDDLHVGHKKLTLEQLIKTPDMDIPAASMPRDEEWVQVDFNRHGPPAEEKPSDAAVEEDDWVMESPRPALADHPALRESSVTVRSLEDDFYADEFEDEGEAESEEDDAGPSEAPIISHTLIDLYCGQRYYDKAIELLEKILELNPEDEASVKKLAQVRELRSSESGGQTFEETEREGHEELINLIETQVKNQTPKNSRLHFVFNRFLDEVKARASEKR